MTDEDIVVVNSTARSSGAVGKNAIVPKYVSMNVDKQCTILDFGSGPDAIHTKSLLEKGFNVRAIDIGVNFNTNIHRKSSLNIKYNVVFASNVINVQPNQSALNDTFASIFRCIKKTGRLIFNLPRTPRKMNLKNDMLMDMLNKRFKEVNMLRYSCCLFDCLSFLG